MAKAKRQLYQCLNAKVLTDKIYCSKGHKLPKNKASILSLQRGDPLQFTICQGCPDYDEMGEPLNKEDRGWL